MFVLLTGKKPGGNDHRSGRLGGERLLHRLVGNELYVLYPVQVVVLDVQTVENGTQRAAYDHLAKLMVTKRSPLRHEHQYGYLVGNCERRQRIRKGREAARLHEYDAADRKSTRLNSSHVKISYA